MKRTQNTDRKAAVCHGCDGRGTLSCAEGRSIGVKVCVFCGGSGAAR